MKSVWSHILLLTLVFALPQANAKEGFSSSLKDAPPAVKKVWEQTFGLVRIETVKNQNYFLPATAFMVKKNQSDFFTHVYFFTADHTLPDDCTVGSICKNRYLYSNVNTARTLSFSSFGHYVVSAFEIYFRGYYLRSRWPIFTDIQAVYRNKEMDAAIFDIVILNEDAKKLPEPVEFVDTCELKKGDPVFMVGFPSLSLRERESHRNISRIATVTKRWSEGMYLGRVKFKGEGEIPLFGNTADSLPGNSGSPIVNAEGKVVSIHQAGFNGKLWGDNYQGSEIPENPLPQGFGLTCQNLQVVRQIIP